MSGAGAVGVVGGGGEGVCDLQQCGLGVGQGRQRAVWQAAAGRKEERVGQGVTIMTS